MAEELVKEETTEQLPIAPDTIVRTIVMVITLINAIGALLGWNPLQVDQATLYQIVSSIALVLSTVWSWWKNNSFTQPALLADKKLAELRNL